MNNKFPETSKEGLQQGNQGASRIVVQSSVSEGEDILGGKKGNNQEVKEVSAIVLEKDQSKSNSLKHSNNQRGNIDGDSSRKNNGNLGLNIMGPILPYSTRPPDKEILSSNHEVLPHSINGNSSGEKEIIMEDFPLNHEDFKDSEMEFVAETPIPDQLENSVSIMNLGGALSMMVTLEFLRDLIEK